MNNKNTENKSYSIALVLPYFGKFPNYFRFYLASCRNNPTVDWLIYTDDMTTYDYPDNVHVKYVSFQDFREKVQSIFPFPIALQRPYKLCDYRPAYGEILADDLKGYDFWGHCDCDMIFGGIRRFVTAERMEQTDVFHFGGPLTLYRNTPEINALYRTQKDAAWKEVFSQEDNFVFDEIGVWSYLGKHNLSIYSEPLYDNIVNGFDGFRLTKEKILPYMDVYSCRPEALRYLGMRRICYTYDFGRLDRVWLGRNGLETEEVLYAHFLKRKMTVNNAVESGEKSAFWVVPDEFIPPQTLEADTLKRLSPPWLTKVNVLRYGKEIARSIRLGIGIRKPAEKARESLYKGNANENPTD
ncbi:MAG: hypothetical protein IJU66_07825 [Oscillospiraceae bacterium]|nr:hypothetical protein [Oscillospiraceae bacterium]